MSNKKEWVKKKGYETCILAREHDLEASGTEMQLVRFHQSKDRHYHKKKTEFFYFTAGRGSIIFNKKEKIEISPGTPVLIKPGARHEIIVDEGEVLEAVMIKTNHQEEDTFT